MAGSIYGKIFSVTTWGESHGSALGAVVDGCPAGIKVNTEIIQEDLDRRKPGQTNYSSPRREQDQVQILSGVFQGKTTGTPISLLIPNQDQRSKDYRNLATIFRPGHADYTYWEKYQIRDYRGGGRASGRETAARVGAGAIAKQLLSVFGIKITAYTYAIGEITIDRQNFNTKLIQSNPLAMPDHIAATKATAYIDELKANQDSTGGIAECIVTGIPAGLGEPVFAKLDAMLAQGLFSIGAVKAVEIGSGVKASSMTGSKHNDSFYYQDDGTLAKKTNNAGGILGGISDGSPLNLRVHFKPTPSIGQTQTTVNQDKENISIEISGRHDPVIVPRAIVVIEAMVALTLADYLLIGATANINNLKKLFLTN